MIIHRTVHTGVIGYIVAPDEKVLFLSRVILTAFEIPCGILEKKKIK
jgi:hypothetical protein